MIKLKSSVNYVPRSPTTYMYSPRIQQLYQPAAMSRKHSQLGFVSCMSQASAVSFGGWAAASRTVAVAKLQFFQQRRVRAGQGIIGQKSISSTSMAATQSAIIVQQAGVARLIHDRPIPALRDEYILVKTAAVAVNPTDWKQINSAVGPPGPLVGCDYAGTVEAVGPKVTKSFKKGDRVCGLVRGANAGQHEDGTFAEYIVAKGDLQIEVPENLNFEEAATLGVGITSVGQGLYKALGLAPPSAPLTTAEPILIYGGSTSSGSLGIQFAKLSGYTVITTCSARNFDYVKSLGADAVFDYHDPQCAAEIAKFAQNKLALVWDTVSVPSSAEICANALSTSPGTKYASLLPIRFSRPDVETFFTSGYTAPGEAYQFGDGREIPANLSDYEFVKQFWDSSRHLLEAGKVKVHRRRVGKGLLGVLDGLELLKANKVSGEKLVYVLP